ncbi:MAG: DUF2341 domain-containing protein, partial [Candidatus Thorarchaeota archaeon]
MAWLSGWSYRKEITITGQSGAGTNYQIDLSIGDSAGGDFHLEGHCTNFPQDIAVTDNDGTTPLDYWIEDITADPLKMWVKVADDLGSNQTIYIYYGKSGATTDSDISSTFVFGDDFNDGNYNGWTVVSGTFSAASNYLATTSALTNLITVDSPTNDPVGRAIRSKVYSKDDVSTSTAGGVILGYQDSSNYYHLRIHENLDKLQLYKWSGGSATLLDETAVTITTNTWYVIELRWISASTLSGQIWNMTGTSLGIVTENATGESWTTGDYGIRGYDPAIYADDVFVRKYTATEPAFSSAGSEETQIATATDLLHGKIRIKDSSINLADSKVQILDIATILADGKLQVKYIDTDLVDGKLRVQDIDTGLADGKLQVQDIDTDLVDGKLKVGNIGSDLADGKVQIQDSVTNLADGKVKIKDISTVIADAKVKIIEYVTSLADGKINIKDTLTNVADGKVRVLDVATGIADGLIQI